jgi:hypothetical protein
VSPVSLRSTTSCANPTPCPINCTGFWSNWTNCTATCAGGNQTSFFTITAPAQHGGAECEAANGTLRSQACNTHTCPEDCWGVWSNWTECSTACGTGYHTSNFTIIQDKLHGGADCEAGNNTMRNETCNTQPCPMACVGEWGPWGGCSASCDGGSRASSFVITQHALHGGADCVAPDGSIGSEVCNEHHCPIGCVGESAE